MGFKLVDSGFNGSSDRVGTAMTHHYTMTRNAVGGKPSVDNIVRPITHHVLVDEFGKNPGKYNVSYHVTQDGRPYADADYDTLRRHQDNMRGGVADPIKEVMQHHQGVAGAMKREKAAPLIDVDENTVHRLVPNQNYHMTPGWGEDDPRMKQPRYLRSGPEYPMQHLNAAQDQPLDPYVHNTLTKSFNYMGRISPDDPHTDVYHVSYEDPQDPYMRYGFTVRHMPEATSSPVTDYRRGNKGKKDPLLPKPLIFSYHATHYPTDMTEDDGDYPTGDFLPVSGEGAPVAAFTKLGPLVERHHNVLRSVGLMALPPRRKRPAWHFTAAFQDLMDQADMDLQP